MVENLMATPKIPQEPQWILDGALDKGGLFWRRNSTSKARVKFKHDVEVKEFRRMAHEMDDAHWEDNNGTNIFTLGMTCLLCVTVTVILPWYILVDKNIM